MPFERSKKIARLFKRELIVISACCRMNAPPRSAKLLRALATGYLCMPFDLISDFIPRIGHLDDAVIIPALVFAALRSSLLKSCSVRHRYNTEGFPRRF